MDVVREVIRAPHGLEALAQVMRYIRGAAKLLENISDLKPRTPS
jgi:hypothetical protein